MLQQVTIRVELGPYTLQGREVDFLEVRQAVGEHVRCELAFHRDPLAVASEVSSLRLGELAGAAVRVVFVADGGDECLAFEGRVREAEIDHVATGAGNVMVLALSDSYTLAEHVDRQYLREQTLSALAGRLNVRVEGSLPSGAPRDYIQHGVSAWAFLAQVAAEEGLQLRARWPRTPDGAKDMPAELGRGFADQTHTVTWGRELLRLATSLAPVNSGVTGEFYDPAEKHDHRFRGVRKPADALGGAGPVVSAARDVATKDADGGDPGHLEPGRVGGVRARTLAEFRERLELESVRRAGAAVRARGASVLPALRAGDRIQIEAAETFSGDVASGEVADRTGLFGLTAVTHRWTGTLYENAFTATPWAGYHPSPTVAGVLGGVGEPAGGDGAGLGAGLTLAVVTDNADEKKRGRVRVRFAYMSEGEQSQWIRVAGMAGGNSRGVGALPSVGDEVVVAAVAGDPEHPVVLGALWNGVDKSSHVPGRQVWITPAGNTLVFLEDDPGSAQGTAETVELHTREGKAWVQLAQQGPTGVPTVTVHSEGDLSLEAPNGQLRLNAKNYLAHITEGHATQVGGAHTTKVTGAITVLGDARLAMKAGAEVAIVAGAAFRAHASAVSTVVGSQVTLNPPGASAPTVTAAVPVLPRSSWGPRPVPPPGPGRSTEDPKTPTTPELAARAQKTSLVVPPAAGAASSEQSIPDSLTPAGPSGGRLTPSSAGSGGVTPGVSSMPALSSGTTQTVGPATTAMPTAADVIAALTERHPSLAAAMAQSRTAAQAAKDGADALHKRAAYEDKTVSRDQGDTVTTSVSGWKPLPTKHAPLGYAQKTPEEVRNYCEKIGHNLQENGGCDQTNAGGWPGKYHASHAEKQMALLKHNEPIGVSEVMCPDCQAFFRAHAAHTNQVQCVTDPDATRVFFPDGTVVALPAKSIGGVATPS